MLADDLTLPTKPFLISKIGDINRLINHQFTPEEIQQKLERSGVLEQRFNTLERVTLVNRRQKAEARGDEEVVAQLTKEIAEIDGPKLAFNTSLYSASPKPANAGPTQQERLAELNRANRKANAADVRKAQQAERKAEALARKRVERGEAVADPFARVKTRASHELRCQWGTACSAQASYEGDRRSVRGWKQEQQPGWYTWSGGHSSAERRTESGNSSTPSGEGQRATKSWKAKHGRRCHWRNGSRD